MRRLPRRRRGSFVGLGLLLLVSLVCASGCERDADTSATKAETRGPQKSDPLREEVPRGTYWLNVKVDQFKGSYTLLCNGFPVKKMWVNIIETNDEWAAKMQTALIGKGNVASIRIRPFLRHTGEQLTIGTAELEAWVEIEESRESYVPLHRVKGAEGEGRLRAKTVDSAFVNWEERAQREWKRLLKKKSTPREAYTQLKTWRWKNPIEITTTSFENRHGPDFSRIFEEAPVISDTARLKDYAMQLRDLFESQDTLALYQVHKPKFEAIDFSRPKALETIGTNWLKYDWHLDFDRSDLAARRWAGGRVWEIYRDDALSDQLSKEALLLAGEDRLATWHAVYVAEIDGELKVVR